MSAVRLPTPAWVVGVHHVQLTYPAALHAQVHRFYGDVLALPCLAPVESASEQRPVFSYLAGAQRIDLVARWSAAGHAAGASAPGHVALQVAGITALHQRLLDAQLHPLAIVQVDEGMRFYGKDPAGNTLEFLQPGPVRLERPRAALAVPVSTQALALHD